MQIVRVLLHGTFVTKRREIQLGNENAIVPNVERGNGRGMG